jgi:hypothetical protein
MFTHESCKIPFDMENTIDQLIAQGVSKTNSEGKDDTNFLAAMFDQLNIIAADTTSTSQTNAQNAQ